jgi:hypothetical protein
VAAIAAALSVTGAEAQVVAGAVRAEDDGRLQAGAVVVAVDTMGRRVASTVTGVDGRYQVVLPGAGTYWLRVTTPPAFVSVSPPFQLEDGEELGYDHSVPGTEMRRALALRSRACANRPPRFPSVVTPAARVRLVDETNATPIPDAAITLLDAKGQPKAGGLTDETGVVALGTAPALGDLLCIRRVGVPLAARPAAEAPTDATVPWVVAVRMEARELAAVEVRATRAQRMRELFVPPTARFYTSAEFAKFVPSAWNFGDLLRFMNAPGVQLRNGADGRVNCVMLRSFTCLPTLVDNVPTNTVYDLDPSLIDAIAILAPSDAQQRYGQLGINGIVLIFTKNAQQRRDEADRRPPG